MRMHFAFALSLCLFSVTASADVLIPVGFVSYDVTGPPSSAQFDLTNLTGPTNFVFGVFPVVTLVPFLNLNLSVTLENGSSYTCHPAGAGCPSDPNPYFTLAGDGESFNGTAFAIGAGNEPVKTVLGGTFGVTSVTLDDGTTWDIAPNVFFDVSGVTSPNILDLTGSCQDATTGCLNDGDHAVIFAEAHPATSAVPEPGSLALLAAVCLAMLLWRAGRTKVIERRGFLIASHPGPPVRLIDSEGKRERSEL